MAIPQAAIYARGQMGAMVDTFSSDVNASLQRWKLLSLDIGLCGDVCTKFERVAEFNGPVEPKSMARKASMHGDINALARAKSLTGTIDHICL